MRQTALLTLSLKIQKAQVCPFEQRITLLNMIVQSRFSMDISVSSFYIEFVIFTSKEKTYIYHHYLCDRHYYQRVVKKIQYIYYIIEKKVSVSCD